MRERREFKKLSYRLSENTWCRIKPKPADLAVLSALSERLGVPYCASNAGPFGIALVEALLRRTA